MQNIFPSSHKPNPERFPEVKIIKKFQNGVPQKQLKFKIGYPKNYSNSKWIKLKIMSPIYLCIPQNNQRLTLRNIPQAKKENSVLQLPAVKQKYSNKSKLFKTFISWIVSSVRHERKMLFKWDFNNSNYIHNVFYSQQKKFKKMTCFPISLI